MGCTKRAATLLVSVSISLALSGCHVLPAKTVDPTSVHADKTSAMPIPTSKASEATPTPMPTQKQGEIPTPYQVETIDPLESLEPEETDEPEPIPVYDIPDIKKAGLTNEQFYRINLMLIGISGSCLYKKPIKSLASADCLIYSFYVLNNLYSANHLPITINEDNGANTSVSLEDMKQLIESAFGNQFNASCKSTPELEVQLIDNQYNFYLMEGDPRNYPFVYQIVKTGKDTWRLRFDVVGVHYQYSVYRNKVEATIQKNKNSIYGFTLKGWKVLKHKTRLFDTAAASSFHASGDGMTFLPKNVLDGNQDTFWLSKPERESWLKVSFNKTTVVTGFNLNMDYINEHYSEELSVYPASVTVELSDGTKIPYDDYSLTPGFRSFAREVKVKWIKFVFPAETSETGQPLKTARYVIDVFAH